jgi:hypothetical protein
MLGGDKMHAEYWSAIFGNRLLGDMGADERVIMKIDVKQIGCEGKDRIQWAQDNI